MSHRAPFVVYLKVIPNRGKRFEHVRSLQRVARLVYDALDAIANVQLAIPGGGQSSQFGNDQNSDYASGLTVKPQFGETPAQLSIAGFVRNNTGNAQPHPDKTIIHAGAYFTGAGGPHTHRANPTSAVETELKSLKSDIENRIAIDVPGETITVFRIDYKGITWGDRGLHFPQ